MNGGTSGAGEPVVELRSVTKSFDGKTRAVDRVSLSVRAGEIMALLGTSGCGKTTTLRIINRLVDPDSGEVRVRGAPVADQRPELLRRSIGYVIQEGGLFPHQNVADNVATVPRLLRWQSRRVHARVREVLELVGLSFDEFARRRPGSLSGGQRQRVGVARALASDPDLLLMDEPFGALDPITREALHAEFLDLQTRLRKTVILVTHDMLEAGKLADRIALMNSGGIAQVGTIRELLFSPADDFVRAFCGAHRPQMTFENLRLDDILDDVSALESGAGGEVVELDGEAILRSVLEALGRSKAGARLRPRGGRHEGRLFELDAVRRRLFEDLVDR